jgi:hypothetical protein
VVVNRITGWRRLTVPPVERNSSMTGSFISRQPPSLRVIRA